LMLVSFDTVSTPLFQWLAGLLAVAFCAVLVHLAGRWPRARWWIFGVAAVLSLLQALLTAWMATHG